MTESNNLRGGSAHSHSTTYTYGETYSTGESVGMTNCAAGIHGRACAAVEAEAIRTTLQTLAAEIPLNDFLWLRLAIDAAFDELLLGDLPE